MMLASNMAETLGKERSVGFVSAQCDDFEAFKMCASKELRRLNSRLSVISDACDRVLQSIDAFEMYSYQFNIKVMGIASLAAKETIEQTANLCLKIFYQIGVKAPGKRGIQSKRIGKQHGACKSSASYRW